MEIASELGIKVSQNDELESVIYAILDKAAENSAAGVSAPKRKRTRIAKDNNKVYAVNGSDGETYDKEATKVEKKKKKSLDAPKTLARTKTTSNVIPPKKPIFRSHTGWEKR